MITPADVWNAQANAVQGFVDGLKENGVLDNSAFSSMAAEIVQCLRNGPPQSKT